MRRPDDVNLFDEKQVDEKFAENIELLAENMYSQQCKFGQQRRLAMYKYARKDG